MAVGERKPTEKEKKLLVRYKRYNNIDEIPELVKSTTLRKMFVISRIRLASYLTVGLFFGSLIYAKGFQYISKEQKRKDALKDAN